MWHRRLLIVVSFIVAASLLISGYSFSRMSGNAQLRVFCAGSLALPLEKVARAFESENPGIDVVIEPSGSLLAIRKIVDLGKSADVLVVSDSRLIPNLMMPEHADFYISFASNEIVLAYTDGSRYSDEVASGNWFRILARPDVKFGVANPNDDPCGYRSLMTIALAEEYYRKRGLFDELIAKRSNILFEELDGEFFIYVPKDFAPNPGSNLIVRSKAEDLIALLEAGTLDYAFQYRSVAAQHGLRYVVLPAEIALSDPMLDDFYRKVRVYLFYGAEGQEEVVGRPITYGLTIPKSCRNVDLAIEFVNFMLGDVGRRIFEEEGHPFLEEFEVVGEVPAGIIVGR
ncbi:MAG: tungstate ABC transporter substrate-binding protein WtpA [Aigarchaeota archaeon]|nr:tungstate ABC transporter substrate-binding protein WtpA [Aigarchaeota archaeon]MDW8021219.1 tungstate ABC transporter substrate-binding protein WtpA [Nitrososphaerota archaeon]